MSEMTTGRLEAFSDGVIAIIVTIMVLELRAPSQPTLAALWKVAPVFLSYAQLPGGGNHVGQPPSPDPRRARRYGTPALEQSLSAVLDVSDPVRDRLLGKELSRANGGRTLRAGSCSVRVS